MKYIFFLQLIELFFILNLPAANEYKDDIVITFIMISVLFLVFFVLLKYNQKYKAHINTFSIINLFILSTWLIEIISSGVEYFEMEWKLYESYQFKNTLIIIIIIIMQIIKLTVVNWEKIKNISRARKSNYSQCKN
ncbi:hypothetical protein KAU19_00980 [Candidatus Parcubacteria bacterium]|nr:hypothetical protein [Candidatus Parcubacteria bacterium]